jgi:hypothetical protein
MWLCTEAAEMVPKDYTDDFQLSTYNCIFFVPTTCISQPKTLVAKKVYRYKHLHE